MKKEIPKIIHQIWSGIEEPLPADLKAFGETWKRDYPDWEYEFWDNKRMHNFVKDNYPQYLEKYYDFQYNIHRFDAIRYLILNKIGGMYVDFDYESLKPLTDILKDKSCCFSQEPPMHRIMTGKYFEFNNALMLSTPEHPFMRSIIEAVFSSSNVVTYSIKYQSVFSMTGPWLISRLYENLDEKMKKNVYIIPYELVSPMNLRQARAFKLGYIDQDIQYALDSRKMLIEHHF